ncbi:MAG: hypothetical protein JXN59_14500 [Anaerolineae bacterium]|nr:hypothetical protein [Anaerolineae bacterium]
MPIEFEWADDERQHILILRFDNPWSWLEFRQAILKAVALIKERPQTVDIILDLVNCSPFHHFDGMPHIWQLMRQCRLPEPSYFVLVSHDPTVRVIASVIRHSQPRLRDYMLVVETEAEAYTTLAYHRQ